MAGEPDKGGVEPVEVKKRRLRVALRQARSDAGLTQKAAADGLVWSVSKIVRIEQGTVPVAPTDVRAMLHLYRVTDEDRVEQLVELAKEAREDKGWSAFDDVISPATKELVGNEPAARVIYKYEPSVVPGLMQTQDYARALLRLLANSIDDAERLLTVRTKRQRMLEEPNRPELNFILGEAALLRPVGGPEVMREQLAHLLALATVPGINLSLLPFSAGAHRGIGSPFTVLQFDDPLLADLLYLENADRESVSREDQEEVKRHLDLFVELQDMADRAGGFEQQVRDVLERVYQPVG
ncbi:MAG TPA: helix-turn-helix transcriptional regulator [Pseudonocardiaceae bacterium]